MPWMAGMGVEAYHRQRARRRWCWLAEKNVSVVCILFLSCSSPSLGPPSALLTSGLIQTEVTYCSGEHSSR